MNCVANAAPASFGVLPKPGEPDQDRLWREDESLNFFHQRLAEGSGGIQLVSFDFFDTLVSRLCAEPSDLFVEVGRQLAGRGLLARPLSPTEFRSARLAADEQARVTASRQGRSPEIHLANIYEELREVVTDSASAQAVEFEVERAFCYLNPAVVSLVRWVRRLGCKTCIVSDTYFSGAELERLLLDQGMPPSWFDRIFTSNECAKAKWSVDLYHEVLRHFDLHPSEVIHLGDNATADIARARQAGIEAVHYYRLPPALEPVFAGESSLRGANTHPAASLNSLRVMTARHARSASDAFRDGATVFGPVLCRYADWCVETLHNAGVRKVLALMREGELLGELVQRAAAAAGIALEVAPCYVSRRSTALAGTTGANVDNTMALLEGCASTTPLAILQILGMDQEVASALEPAFLEKPLGSPEIIRECVRVLFESPNFRRASEDRRQEKHQLAFDYLSALAGEEPVLGLLDLGWSGSIQRNISRILRLGGRRIQTVGCYVACSKRSGRLALEGDIAHAYLESDWRRSTILAEIAITACVGSTDGYRRNASGGVDPVLGDFAITPAERQIKERLREGVLAFQSNWLMLRRTGARPALSREALADLDLASASILYRLIEFPTKAEADRLGALRHDENYFGQSLSAALCDGESLRDLRQRGVLEVFRRSRSYWPQGVVAQGFPRLVSALRGGWSDPLALGRWGAWSAAGAPDPGITDEEAAHLETLLSTLGPRQVLFIGPVNPELAAALLRALPAGESCAARVLVANPGSGLPASQSLHEGYVQLPFQKVDVESLGPIRDQLSSAADTALVFSEILSPSDARLLLNGLAPFLGPQGAILAPAGRLDFATRHQDSGLIRELDEWLKVTGCDLGYSPWGGSKSLLPELCGWMTARRSPGFQGWNFQWMTPAATLAPAHPVHPSPRPGRPAESGASEVVTVAAPAR